MCKSKFIYSMLFIFLLSSSTLFSDEFEKAIIEGEYWKVKAMIDLGRDVNKTVTTTPLNLAAQNARKDIAVLLVENGARVDLPDTSLNYPLPFAARGLGNWYAKERLNDFLWIAQYLLDLGADVNSRDWCGYVAIDWAVSYEKVSTTGAIEFAYLLIRNGADLNLLGPLVDEFQRGKLREYQNSLINDDKEEDLPKDENKEYWDDHSYKILDVGTLLWDTSKVYCINDLGQTCGSVKTKKKRKFFIANSEKGLTFIDLPFTAVPGRINNNGEVTGNYRDKKGKQRGFFWRKDLGFVDIGTLGGGNTWVYAMNDSGQIVGGSETGKKSHLDKQQKVVSAFLWEYSIGDDNMKDLGVLKGDDGISGDQSCAVSINNNGEIVGFSNISFIKRKKRIRGNNLAVKWSASGPVKLLKQNYEDSKALFINDIGQIAIARTMKNKLSILDVNTRNIYDLPFGGIWKVVLNNSNCAIINEKTLIHYIFPVEKEVQFDSLGLTEIFNYVNDNDGYWRKIIKLIGINDDMKIPAIGENFYKENHALLLYCE